MGGSSPIVTIPEEQTELYYFKNSPDYIDDSLLKHKVKLEFCLKNILEFKDIKIQLIYYEDSNKTIQQSYGQIRLDEFDAEKSIMTSQQFLVVDYFFEKEMPIEFRFSGDMNNTIHTTLPSIMGSKHQTYKKPIEGTDLVFEVKGFSYRNKIYSNLNIDVEIDGKVSEKYLRYRIIAKGTKEKQVDQLLYWSALYQVTKNLEKVNFKRCVIPDIYVTPDEDYNNCNISIELIDCQKKNL